MSTSNKPITISGRQIEVPAAEPIRSILQDGIPELSAVQIDQIQRYIALLLLWNEKLNLTSIEEPLEIITRHFAESALGLPHIPQNSRLADVGTGAGFPGMAIKIFRSDVQVLLIEQNSKKAAFLNEAIRTAELANVTVARSNYLDLGPDIPHFHVITARALGEYRQLLTWAHLRLSPGGKVLLWLGAEESIKLSKLPGWEWDQPTRLAESRRRELLVGYPK